MKHTSVQLESPIELVDIVPLNPYISKCQIKVCYVGDEPNRNHSIITKDVAKQMANSLPGCPIVGYYSEEKEDFTDHSKFLEIKDGELKVKDNTTPCGFVDLNAKVWFAKYQDDDEVEREYLVTEGFLWTGLYPQCQDVIDNQNPQSMELDEKTLKADWTKNEKGQREFFIINEAIISKLCILGQDVEPCFEGSKFEQPVLQFSYGEDFQNKLFSMMNELKDLLEQQKGGMNMFNTYAVEIGDGLWSLLWRYLDDKFDGHFYRDYCLEGVYEDDEQKFAVIQEVATGKLYRMDFSLTEEEGFVSDGNLVEVVKDFAPQFSLEGVQAYVDSLTPAEPEEVPAVPTYNLEEVVEYQELLTKFAALEESLTEASTRISELEAANEALNGEIGPLREFKLASERKEKEQLIAKFYMLNDEDKANVVANIDTYSLHDIEAELSIICVRNKVSFDLEDDKSVKTPSVTFSLETNDVEDTIPAWVQAALNIEKNK